MGGDHNSPRAIVVAMSEFTHIEPDRSGPQTSPSRGESGGACSVTSHANPQIDRRRFTLTNRLRRLMWRWLSPYITSDDFTEAELVAYLEDE